MEVTLAGLHPDPTLALLVRGVERKRRELPAPALGGHWSGRGVQRGEEEVRRAREPEKSPGLC